MTPAQEYPADYEAGRRDGSTRGVVFGASFSPGWNTPQARRDAYREGFTAGREGR